MSDLTLIEVGGKSYLVGDGKYYDEDLNEVSCPIKRARKTATAHGVTFVEGECYENYFGKYEVKQILGDGKMRVEYVEVKTSDVVVGMSKVYPVASQGQTIANEKEEKERKIRLLGVFDFEEKHDFLLDYLKEHGRIYANVPPSRVAGFNAEYELLTGHSPKDHLGHGYRIDDRGPDKPEGWGIWLEVHFPLCEEVVKALPEGLVIHERDNWGEVSNNDFCRGLLRKGFELGANKDNSRVELAVA